MISLKYIGYSIVFQEVPNEISLAINVSGCQHHCAGCHSQFLWEDRGRFLLSDLDDLLRVYATLITTVCFMGGDQNLDELKEALILVKKKGLKTCAYFGCDDVDVVKEILPYLDFIKLGHYDQQSGGLDSRTTNQRFYAINHPSLTLTDMTTLFQKHYQ